MPRKAKGLTAAGAAHAKPGRWGDGAGLYLLVRPSGARYWLFRYTRGGRAHELGLGVASGRGAVTLAEARDAAAELRKTLRAGRDPLAEKREARAALFAAAAEQRIAGVTFKDEAEAFIAAHSAGWRSAKHAQQWESSLRDYVFPTLGALSVAAITVDDIRKVLEPIWTTKPETASRVRGRIESILDASKAKGNRSGENPARWKGNLAHMLAKPVKLKRVKHHDAMAYQKIPEFMAQLRQQEGVVARALEFTILAAARSGEVLGATWGEFDFPNALWAIPGERMKSGRSHLVPLCLRAIEIAGETGDGFIFANAQGNPLASTAMLALLRAMGIEGVTILGFRSSFKDWNSDQTNHPSELSEMALAHAVGNATERAYARSVLLAKRREMMNDWARFCTTVPSRSCVPLGKVAKGKKT